MTAEQPPDSSAGSTSEEQPRRAGQVFCSVASGAVLVILNLGTACFAIFAWIMTPEDAYDQDILEGIGIAAFLGTGLALIGALLTVIAVSAK